MFVQPTFHTCSDRCQKYHQALHDFKVTELIDTTKTLFNTGVEAEWMHFEEPDMESLAVLLIQQLTLMLQSQSTDQSLWMLKDDGQAIADLPAFELKPPQSFKALPEWFPEESSNPKFADGAVVRWNSFPEHSEIQTGIVLGHFYAYARHQRQWTWKYLVWLKQPVCQVVTDTAWETDLEILSEEPDYD